MSYEETKKQVLEYLTKPGLTNEFLNRNEVTSLRETFLCITNQLDKLNNNESLDNLEDILPRVLKAAKVFLTYSLYEPISVNFKDFSDAYLTVIFNWNKEIAKSTDLDQTITASLHLIRMTLTVTEALKALQKLTSRAEKLSTFFPPAFSNSRHYLESLDEITKEKDV